MHLQIWPAQTPESHRIVGRLDLLQSLLKSRPFGRDFVSQFRSELLIELPQLIRRHRLPLIAVHGPSAILLAMKWALAATAPDDVATTGNFGAGTRYTFGGREPVQEGRSGRRKMMEPSRSVGVVPLRANCSVLIG